MSKKIVKFDNGKKEVTKIELTEEELKLKEKLMEIDRKIISVHNVVDVIASENKDTIFVEDVVDSSLGFIAVTAATNILAEYFGVDKMSIDDLI